MMIMILRVALQRSLMIGVVLEQSSRAENSNEHIATKADYCSNSLDMIVKKNGLKNLFRHQTTL